MKTILHLAKKDLVRLRWAWLLWTLLLVGEIALAEFTLTQRALDPAWFGQMTMAQMLLLLGHSVAVGALVSFQVMEDPPAGDQGFWLTRPISGAKLLAAKFAVMLLLFWVWPVVIAMPWWLHSGVEGRPLVNAALQAGMFNFAIIIPVWALAAVSRSYGRFLMAGFLIGLAALVLFFVAMAGAIHARGLIDFNLTVPVSMTFLTCVVVVLVLYLTRASAWAKWLFSVGLFGAAALVLLVLLDPRGGWFSSAVPVMALPGGDVVRPRLTDVNLVIDQGGDARLKLEFAVQGVPDEIALLSGVTTMRLDWADGTTFVGKAQQGMSPHHTPVKLFALGAPVPDVETAAKHAAVREELLRRMKAEHRPPPSTEDDSRPAGRFLSLEFVVPVRIAERIAAEAPHCAFDFTFKLGRTTRLADVPMAPRTSVTANGLRLTILDLVDPPAPTKPAMIEAVAVYAAARPVQFYRVDRERGAVDYLDALHSHAVSLVPLSRTVARTVMRVELPKLWRTDRWVTDREGLARSELVVTTTAPIGNTSAQLVVDRLAPNRVKRIPDGN